jgi:hypothetical protein
MAPAFLSRYVVDHATGCWLWQGCKDRNGYGLTKGTNHSPMVPAHALFYQYHRGLYLPELELDHLCRTPSCVNPWHLEPVTHAVNVQRGKLAKLNPMVVREIRDRREAGEDWRALAKAYGVSPYTIWDVCAYRTWKNVA